QHVLHFLHSQPDYSPHWGQHAPAPGATLIGWFATKARKGTPGADRNYWNANTCRQRCREETSQEDTTMHNLTATSNNRQGSPDGSLPLCLLATRAEQSTTRLLTTPSLNSATHFSSGYTRKERTMKHNRLKYALTLATFAGMTPLLAHPANAQQQTLEGIGVT